MERTFTIVLTKDEVPEHYHMPISHAKRSLTLACLIPSNTLTYTMPSTCRRESLVICDRVLELLTHTPLSFTYDVNATLPGYQTLIDNVSDLQLQAVAETALTLGMTAFGMFCGTRMLNHSSSSSVDVDHSSQIETSSVGAPVASSDLDSDSLSNSLSQQIFIVSDSGIPYSLRRSLSQLSPVLSEAVAAGNDRVDLLQCDGTSIALVIEFLELLTQVPLIIKTNSVHRGTPFYDVVPHAYDSLLRNRMNLTDGSSGRIWKVCDALQLETLRLLLNMKTASLLTEATPRTIDSLRNRANQSSVNQSIVAEQIRPDSSM